MWEMHPSWEQKENRIVQKFWVYMYNKKQGECASSVDQAELLTQNWQPQLGIGLQDNSTWSVMQPCRGCIMHSPYSPCVCTDTWFHDSGRVEEEDDRVAQRSKKKTISKWQIAFIGGAWWGEEANQTFQKSPACAQVCRKLLRALQQGTWTCRTLAY